MLNIDESNVKLLILAQNVYIDLNKLTIKEQLKFPTMASREIPPILIRSLG